jgi:rhodanese-related sulfurtransferase
MQPPTAGSTRPGRTVVEPPSSAVDRAVAWARTRLERVAPADLSSRQAAGALVVDLRPEADRRAEGELPGAVVVERIHLEWRLDPTSPHRLPGLTADTEAILVCNEGYASSLAAAALQELGLPLATDLAGGYRAWTALTPAR